MALETRYDGVLSGDLYDAQTADGVLFRDLWAQAQTFISTYNTLRDSIMSFMGFITNRPDADVVSQITVKWQRFSEFGKPDVRARQEYDLAVTTGLEGFQTAIEWTDWAEMLGLSAPYVRSYVRGVAEGDLRDTYLGAWFQFFYNKPRKMEDLLRKPVTVDVMPFYYGASDTRVPPRVGGKTFTANHNHFLTTAASGTVTATDLDAGINTVVEHGFDNDLFIFGGENVINNQVMQIPGDVISQILVRNRYIPADAVNINQPGALVPSTVPINPLFTVTGSFKGKATIAIVRDVPDDYLGFFSHQGPLSPENPLQIRVPAEAQLRGLVAKGDEKFPFVGRYWQKLQGIGIRQYGNGAAMQWNNHAGTYTPPTWDFDIF